MLFYNLSLLFLRFYNLEYMCITLCRYKQCLRWLIPMREDGHVGHCWLKNNVVKLHLFYGGHTLIICHLIVTRGNKNWRWLYWWRRRILEQQTSDISDQEVLDSLSKGPGKKKGGWNANRRLLLNSPHPRVPVGGMSRAEVIEWVSHQSLNLIM